jgi:hypothetical protein
MKRTLFLLAIMTIFAGGLEAQAWKRLRVRESFNDVIPDAPGAALSALFKAGGTDGAALHGGVKFDLVDPSKAVAAGLSVGPLVEVHRHFNSHERELTYMIGAGAEGLYGDPKDFGQRVTVVAAYKNDRELHREGSQVGMRYSMESESIGLGEPAGPDALGLAWQPVVGLEWENRAKVSRGEQTGRIVRGFGSLQVVLFPAHRIIEKRVEVAASYGIWSDFFETSRIIDHNDDHQLIKASVTVFPDPGRHVGIGFDFLRGEDPTNGMRYQKYGAFTVRLRF